MSTVWRAALAAVLMSAAAVAAQTPVPALTGRVIDAQTGEPLGGVTILLSGLREYTATTDADGRYRTEALQTGTYFVTAGRNGYLTGSPQSPTGVPLRLLIRRGGPASVQQDWMLEPAARIRGRLRDAYDNPVEGVRIFAAPRPQGGDAWPSLEAEASATTGPDGRFEIHGLRRGPHLLAFTLPLQGSERWFFSPGILDPRHASLVEAVVGESNQMAELRAAPVSLAPVTVQTATLAGAPIANALVELRPWRPFKDAEIAPVTAVTDNSGRATFYNLPIGRHELIARAPGSLDARATARGTATLVLPDQVTRGVEIRLSPTRQVCLFTRIETDGAARGDLELPPSIDISTRDYALTAEQLEARVQLGETAQLEGLAPQSHLFLTAFAQQPLWALSRFSPGQTAPRGAIPANAAVAGCVAVYFRRTSLAIRGTVALPDEDWVPEIEVVAVPVDSQAAPVARTAMAPDGSFSIPGIAIGMRYRVSAIPYGFDVFSLAANDRQTVMATGGESITVPLSIPIAR